MVVQKGKFDPKTSNLAEKDVANLSYLLKNVIFLHFIFSFRPKLSYILQEYALIEI